LVSLIRFIREISGPFFPPITADKDRRYSQKKPLCFPTDDTDFTD